MSSLIAVRLDTCKTYICSVKLQIISPLTVYYFVIAYFNEFGCIRLPYQRQIE